MFIGDIPNTQILVVYIVLFVKFIVTVFIACIKSPFTSGSDLPAAVTVVFQSNRTGTLEPCNAETLEPAVGLL